MSDLKKVTSFTVKRSGWHRGKGGTDSALLTQHGAKCCVGFYAEACGIRRDALYRVGEFNEIDMREVPADFLEFDLDEPEKEHSDELARFYGTHRIKDPFLDVYADNDDPDVSNEEREKRLTRRFREVGIQVTFED